MTRPVWQIGLEESNVARGVSQSGSEVAGQGARLSAFVVLLNYRCFAFQEAF
jgi:hypothetical protein